MNAFRTTVTALATLLALAACTPLASGGGPAAADEAAIRAAGTAWNEAYRALDADALAALYAEDAVLLPETAESARGMAAIREFMRTQAGLMREGGYQPVIASDVEIGVSGALGFRSGTYSVTDGSGTVVDTGKWLELWRKADGKWLISRSIWNSDQLPLFPPWAYKGLDGPGEAAAPE